MAGICICVPFLIINMNLSWAIRTLSGAPYSSLARITLLFGLNCYYRNWVKSVNIWMSKSLQYVFSRVFCAWCVRHKCFWRGIYLFLLFANIFIISANIIYAYLFKNSATIPSKAKTQKSSFCAPHHRD